LFANFQKLNLLVIPWGTPKVLINKLTQPTF
jgi:hypothetical protein